MSDLSESEKAACIAAIYVNDPLKKWAELTVKDAAENARWWRKQHPQPAEQPGHRSGVTASQLQYIGNAVVDALNDGLLQALVREIVEEIAPEVIDPRIERAVAASESGVATSVEAAMAAAETAAMAVGKAGGVDSTAPIADERVGQLVADLAEVKTATLASLERRLSRHSDHLNGLESRLKKLERG